MIEVFREAIAWVNLPFTLLLALVGIYWISVIVGLSDLEGVEGEMDSDADAESDFLQGILKFFYVGEVPALVVLSVLVLCLWTGMILGNHYLNPGMHWIIAAAILIPVFIASAVITRIVAKPLRRAFQVLNKDYDDHRPVVGRTCIVTTSEVNETFGQATVESTSSSDILINARTRHGEVLHKGETAIIFDEEKEKNLFLVRKLETNPTEK